jgi:hypothetical protein
MLVVEDSSVKSPRLRSSAAAIATILSNVGKDLSAAFWTSGPPDDLNIRNKPGDLDEMVGTLVRHIIE